MSDKAHLTMDGLHKIINIKTSINRGTSEIFQSNFKSKNLIPVKRPVITTLNIPDPNWISGFTAGEGCFSIKITKSTNKIGYRVQLLFRITQHIRDINLMEVIIKYFG